MDGDQDWFWRIYTKPSPLRKRFDTPMLPTNGVQSASSGSPNNDTTFSDSQSQWTDAGDAISLASEKKFSSPTKQSPRRSIDLLNTHARQKVDSLSKASPSLYDIRNVSMRSQSSNISAPRRTLSIELRRPSNESFVSAASVENRDTDPNEAVGRSTFDVGRWTISRESFQAHDPLSRTNIVSTSNLASRRIPMTTSSEVDVQDTLSRITSEPIRGGRTVTASFGQNLNESSQKYGFQMPSLTEMRESVHKVGIVLEERRKEGVSATRKKSGDFWLAFTAIAVCGFLSATDMTIISPILPTIAANLPKSDISATWITSAFLLTMTAFQPLWGGLSDALGRKIALLMSVALFVLGSIPCAAAENMVTMVAGRGLQGLGGGGMLVVGEVLLSDLTTLAERGYFLGLLSMAFAVAAIAAPIVGGAFAAADGLSWRWAFIINFPIGIVAFALVASIRGLSSPKLTIRQTIEHCDAPSAFLLFASILALLIGLTRGGEQYSWSDGQVIAPLACGAIGTILFLCIQWWPKDRNVISPRPILDRSLLFGKGRRTSAIAYALTFLHGMLLYGAVQNLILYFEARDASPLRAAVRVLPANVPSTPAAFAAGVLMAVTARYKGLIIASQALMLIGLGMLVYLDGASPTSQWATFQVIASLGIGAMYTLALPPIQASVPTSHLARATATFAFVRSFGAVWGVSSTLIAYSSQAGQRLRKVPGASQAGYTGATAVGSTTQIRTIADPVLRSGVRQALLASIRIAFAVLVPFAFIGLGLSFFIQHIPLPNYNDSAYVQDEVKQGAAKSGVKDIEKGRPPQQQDSGSETASPSPRLSVSTRSAVPLRRSGSFWR